ncbi:hypothetical protein, partial [Deinococcus pimensis]|uniref:hypothetical protein n=1 Tax=Deinococcus pimensis TaxID=309888 RepID=UPI001B7F8A19
MPRVSKNRPDVPKWARAIALRRVELGRTQTQLAEDGGQDDQGRDYLTQSNVADAENRQSAPPQHGLRPGSRARAR